MQVWLRPQRPNSLYIALYGIPELLPSYILPSRGAQEHTPAPERVRKALLEGESAKVVPGG